MQFLQVSSIPLGLFAKFQYIIREIAKAMDLDPDKVTNNMDEAALQAELGGDGIPNKNKLNHSHQRE